MPPAIRWTEQSDTLIRDLRDRGHSWDAIATALGTSRWTAIERAKLLGAHLPLPAPPRAPRAPDLGREPLPAGHPLTWGALVAGTLLDGAAYPYPPIAPAADSARAPRLRDAVLEWAA